MPKTTKKENLRKVATKPKKVSKVQKKTSKKTAPAKVKSSQTKAKKQAAPRTMEELLKQTGYSLHGLKRGEEVEGMVTDISKRLMLVDVGAKTEGMVTDREFGMAKDLIESLSVGETIKVQISQPENEKGQVLLSLRQAALDYRWNKVEELLKTSESVKVQGQEINKGGLIVSHGLLRGFIPASQFGREYLGQMRNLINRHLQVKVIEVDREKNRLIFSEKAVSEAKILENKKEALSQVKTGETYKGIISGVAPFGIFVRVIIEPANKQTKKTELSLDGLVHISEVSWEKVERLDKLYQPGQEIEVKALASDDKTGKLTLSIKRLQTDPWEKVAKKYPEGAKTKGEITRLAAFGAFVNLENGVDGLIHISKIPAEKEIQVGDKIDCYVESIDVEQRRISLGLVLAKKPIGYK